MYFFPSGTLCGLLEDNSSEPNPRQHQGVTGCSWGILMGTIPIYIRRDTGKTEANIPSAARTWRLLTPIFFWNSILGNHFFLIRVRWVTSAHLQLLVPLLGCHLEGRAAFPFCGTWLSRVLLCALFHPGIFVPVSVSHLSCANTGLTVLYSEPDPAEN